MENDIHQSASGFFANCLAAFLGGDVPEEGFDVADGFYRCEIHSDDEAAHGHVLDGDLAPAAGRGAEIQEGARAGEEIILAVELDEFEGCTRTIPVGFVRVYVELGETFEDVSIGITHKAHANASHIRHINCLILDADKHEKHFTAFAIEGPSFACISTHSKRTYPCSFAKW
jgi:hypothetical protein